MNGALKEHLKQKRELKQTVKMQERMIELLCDKLNGSPLTYPCDSLWQNCGGKCNTEYATSECWKRWAVKEANKPTPIPTTEPEIDFELPF